MSIMFKDSYVSLLKGHYGIYHSVLEMLHKRIDSKRELVKLKFLLDGPEVRTYAKMLAWATEANKQ